VRRLLVSIRHALQPAVGAVVIRRWPWPLWRLRGWAIIPIGPASFRFEQAAVPRFAWWAQQALRRRWEPEVISELSTSLQPGDVFFDVGAFIGAFTLLASRLVGPEGRVVAFEPDPIARQALERNVAANRVANVTIVPFAVGDRPGTVRFAATGNSAGRVSGAGEVEVEMVTLDEFCAESGLAPAVMKMDIEGGEGRALRDSVIVHRLRMLVVEIHAPALREQGVDPAALLASLGPHRLLEPAERGNYGVLVTPTPVS
jgi:FkbM family methyltransferase